MNLNEQQSLTYNTATSAEEGSIFTLRGYAGTGKTFTASRIINHPRFENVLVTAPTGGAIDVLRRKFRDDPEIDDSKITYKTLALLMKLPQSFVQFGEERYSIESDDQMDKFSAAVRKETGVKVDGYMGRVESRSEVGYHWVVDVNGINKALPRGFVEQGVDFMDVPEERIATHLSRYDLVVGDEWSMVDAGTHLSLMKAHQYLLDNPMLADKDHTHHDPILLLCGDDGQLPPVAQKNKPRKFSMRNPMISRSPNNRNIFLLTEQMRSVDSVGQMAIDLREGIDIARVKGVTLTKKATIEQLYFSERETFAQADVVLTLKNDTVKVLNRALRRDKGFKGIISAGERLVNLSNLWWRDAEDYSVQPELLFATSEVLEVAKVLDKDAAVDRLERIEMMHSFDNKGLVALASIKAALEQTDILMVRFTNDKMAFIEPTLRYRTDLEWQMLRNDIFSVLSQTRLPLADLKFAYAMTVHRSQGSEFGSVVYVVTRKHINIQRDPMDKVAWRAPYTAVTRARNKVDVFFSEDGSF